MGGTSAKVRSSRRRRGSRSQQRPDRNQVELGFGEVREWLNRAVSKCDSVLLASCTNLTKSACRSRVCAEFDFTGFPSISSSLTEVWCQNGDTRQKSALRRKLSPFLIADLTGLSHNLPREDLAVIAGRCRMRSICAHANDFIIERTRRSRRSTSSRSS